MVLLLLDTYVDLELLDSRYIDLSSCSPQFVNEKTNKYESAQFAHTWWMLLTYPFFLVAIGPLLFISNCSGILPMQCIACQDEARSLSPELAPTV